jgi:ADP-dependent NAD(P)H-hydrate dehydratase
MIEVNQATLKGLWPIRENQSHKGTYGRILVIAGNEQYGGAGILASSAAVYAGAGLVTLATAKTNFTAVRATLAEIMLIDFLDFEALKSMLDKATGVVIGPGLGTTTTSLKILKFVLANIPTSTPLIIDGSAIDLVASHQLVLHHPHLICTPHQMEWQRLAKIKIANQHPLANQTVVDQLNAMVVLKHHETEIYAPKAEMRRIMAGNPGMATGGSGDALTGIVIALISQVDSIEQGVVLGTFLHSYVADQIYQTEAVVLPHRLIKAIPKVRKNLECES